MNEAPTEERPAGKRYYWLKLQDGFFNSKRIKKLRRLAGGDTYTIIYLKMQLLAMKTDGILRWSGVEDDFASELALDLDETPDNVAVTLQFLLTYGLAETSDNINFFLPYAVENTGSEGSSAKRVREFRQRQALQCNTEVTQVKRLCNVEKEIETEIESDREIEKEKDPSVSSIAEKGECEREKPTGAPADCGKPTLSTSSPQDYQQRQKTEEMIFEERRQAALASLMNKRKEGNL